MILYHFTSEDGRAILQNGFSAEVWLSDGPGTIDGAASTEVLLEVAIQGDIERYRQKVVLDADDEMDGFQNASPAYVWYCIPSDVANSLIQSIRVIERGSDEFAELL